MVLKPVAKPVVNSVTAAGPLDQIDNSESGSRDNQRKRSSTQNIDNSCKSHGKSPFKVHLGIEKDRPNRAVSCVLIQLKAGFYKRLKSYFGIVIMNRGDFYGENTRARYIT